MASSCVSSIRRRSPLHLSPCVDSHNTLTRLPRARAQHRQLAKSLFMPAHLAACAPVFQLYAERLSERLTAAAGGVVDMQDAFFRYTLGSFCQIGFGVEMPTMTGENQFAQAFEAAQTCTAERGFTGGLWKFLPTPARMKDSLRYLDGFCDVRLRCIRRRPPLPVLNPRPLVRHTQTIYTKRKDDSVSSLDAKSDLLSKMLLLRMGKKEIRDFLVNFLIAGRDTTALMLTFSLYELAGAPDAEAKVLDEINAVLASCDDGLITPEHVKQMPFTMMVLKEVRGARGGALLCPCGSRRVRCYRRCACTLPSQSTGTTATTPTASTGTPFARGTCACTRASCCTA